MDVTKIIRRVSPILIHAKVECSQYALRLTPMDKYGNTEIDEFLKTFNDYIYVTEISKAGKAHYHIVLWTDTPEEEVREQTRKFLQKYFPGPPKRGDANKQYNLSQVEDLELSVTYILKDVDKYYHSSNICIDTVEELKKQSFKKFSKENFAKELEELKKQFKLNRPVLKDMMIEIVKLKSLYRQPVNMSHIYQMCVSYDVHNNVHKAETYVLDFLSRYI